jgi:hypothetical protein
MKDKRFYYKTAKIKGLYCCFVAILSYNPESDNYTCRTPFETIRTYPSEDLEDFCL